MLDTKLQIGRYLKLEGELIRGANRYVQVVQKFSITSSPTAFYDVRADRDGGAAHLLCETELLLCGEGRGQVVDRDRQLPGMFRHDQLLSILHPGPWRSTRRIA
jgi:hypothetical protein